MGKLKDLVVEIQDLYINGYDAEDIAAILNVSIAWVYEAVQELDDSAYDGQPDEAQEWYDFDPEC